jgi:Mg-chelatase subunit ChlD
MSVNVPDEFYDPSITIKNASVNKQAEQLARMSRVVSKFASTLTYRPINVHTDVDDSNPNNKAVAWCDADNIYFNPVMLGDVTDPDTVVAIKGLSLHELGHILFTPRSGSNLVKWAKTLGYMPAFNLLEDMRIETFLNAKYSSVKEWFVGTITQYIIKSVDETNIQYLYPVIAGRRYLPQSLLKVAADSYEHQGSVADIERITREYTLLNLSDSAHIPKAQALITEFNNLINSTLGQPNPSVTGKTSGFENLPDPNGHSDKPDAMNSSQTSRPTNKAGQDSIIEKVKKQMPQAGSNPSGDQEGEDVPDDDSSGKGKDGKGKDGKGKDDDGKDGDGKDGDTNRNGGDGNGSSIGQGAGKSGAQSLQDVAKSINDMTKSKLRSDIRDAIQQFNGEAELSTKQVSTPRKSTYRSESVNTEVVSAARSLGKELVQIKGDYDPGWLRKVDMGRLNVQRYVTGSDIDESFDQWDTGREDAVDMEVVVLLDISGSMDWAVKDAYDSMWAIKRALDKINASTTVLTFGSESSVLYSSDERATHQRRFAGTGGGTNPIDALRYSKFIMANSSRAIKIVIAITDGVWSYTKNSLGISKEDAILQEMRRAGVITALAFVDERDNIISKHGEDYANNYYPADRAVDGHGCEVVVKVNHASKLFELGRKLVKVGIARNLERQV